MKLEVTPFPRFSSSPFPYRKREGQETLADGRVITLAPGTTIPDYVRAVYGLNKVVSIRENFPFLNRHDSDKNYTPADTDPFVFRDGSSLSLFKSQALHLLNSLVDMWRSLGLPTTKDEERQIEVPDVEKVMRDSLKSGKPPEQREMIGYITSNVDILLKASLQRTVLPGWWVVSYDGKKSSGDSHLFEAVSILVEAFGIITKSAKFKSVFESTIKDQGDPLDTSIGFPYYTSEMSKEGVPVAKLKMLDQYKGFPAQPSSWQEIRSHVVSRGRSDFEKAFPFAIAPIVRIQPGYKWAHNWRRTDTGFQLIGDVRGNSTNRVAWMAPYMLNLALSPLQSHWKALRKMIPGLFHDGITRVSDISYLKKENPFLLESDFSNYDRSIPVDVISHLASEYAKLTRRPKYWESALNQTQFDIPLIWPDHVSGERGRGWVFTPKSLALLSGLKITSEIGSFMNIIINIAGWLETGYKTRAQTIAYLTSRLSSDYSKPEVLIQSDDTLLIDGDFSKLVAKAEAFETGAKMAGIKSSLSFGDKFLMRHLSSGSDLPVASRIWQNTLNNEDPQQDPLVFSVGLAVRTDGILGYKTFDPFSTGKVQKISVMRAKFETLMLQSLVTMLTKSAVPLVEPIKMLRLLIDAGEEMVRTDSQYCTFPTAYTTDIDVKRRTFLLALAKREAESLTAHSSSAYISELLRNSASPAAALTLETILREHPQLRNLVGQLVIKEHEFYSFAMKKLNFSQTIDLNF